MKAKLVALFYILIFALAGCASKYGIQKTYAYNRKVTAGALPVDNDGRPTGPGMQKDHILFIEMEEGLPQWDTAWIDGRTYTVHHLKIEREKAPVKLGKTKDEATEVVITPETGNSLWQLLLVPLQAAKPAGNVQAKMAENAIVLSGTWKGKKVLYAIKEEKELATVFSE